MEPCDFNFDVLYQVPTLMVKRGRDKGKGYLDCVVAFDIETTNLKQYRQAIMYVWQIAFDFGVCVVGRTWEELEDFLREIVARLENRIMIVYVHNLSFEFQFLRTIHNFQKEEVFAVKSRKVLRANLGPQIELRCSYLHSNMSLAEYTHKMGVYHQKLSGEEYNYDIERYPWTPLTAREMEYVVNDVIGLVEALRIEMELDEDTLVTIPLTSTGYVRRDTKRAMYKGAIADVREMLPGSTLYPMLRQAFRGGNTHANRYYAGRVLHNVNSADRSSSYPDVILNCKYPMTAFIRSGRIDCAEIEHRYDKTAFLMRAALYNVRLLDIYWGAPYISRDKAENIVNGVYDNGRVLSADMLILTITDVDYRILRAEYYFDCEILDCYESRYGRLPSEIRKINIDYYRRKTALKGVDGEEIYYMKSKNKLNSVYGMMAQDPGKQDVIFNGLDFTQGDENIQDLLDNYNKRAFLCYQWGVWVTAWARYRLEDGIRLAADRFVYCDTDSVKYLGDIDWTRYNAERQADSERSGAYAVDTGGITHYMGVYESETPATEFKTLGAKKYVGRIDGKLKITIAGVGKIAGARELENAGGVPAFEPGFVFRDAGGLDAVYNDVPPFAELVVDGHAVKVGPNIYLEPSEYTVGITGEYEKLIKNCELVLDICND